MTTFLPLVGQFDNLGDVFLRRQLAAWISDEQHVLVGSAPDDFVAALALPDTAVVYRSFARWVAAMAVDRTRAGYVYKPGEIQMSAPGMKEHVGLLPLVARLKLAGGHVARVGVGTRSVSAPYVALCRPSVRLGDITVWRDQDTRDAFGRGLVAPDLAFAEGSPASAWNTGERTVVVVSLRGDRPAPSSRWYDAVRAFATRRSLEIVCVSQVRRDDARTRDSAAHLGGRAVPLGDRPFTAVEPELRQLYRSTLVAVSDRLHVLVGAATEGASVSAALDGGSPKIRRHLAVLGIGGLEARTDGRPVGECVDIIERAADSAADVRAGVQRARADLLDARRLFTDAMGLSR